MPHGVVVNKSYTNWLVIQCVDSLAHYCQHCQKVLPHMSEGFYADMYSNKSLLRVFSRLTESIIAALEILTFPLTIGF